MDNGYQVAEPLFYNSVKNKSKITWKIRAGENIKTAIRWQYFRKRILSILLFLEMLQNRKTETHIMQTQQIHNDSLLDGSEKTKESTLQVKVSNIKIQPSSKNSQCNDKVKNSCFTQTNLNLSLLSQYCILTSLNKA